MYAHFVPEVEDIVVGSDADVAADIFAAQYAFTLVCRFLVFAFEFIDDEAGSLHSLEANAHQDTHLGVDRARLTRADMEERVIERRM